VRRGKLWAVALAALLVCFVAVPLAQAAAISDAEELGRFGALGEGAGEMGLQTAVATDPVTGHVYVGDLEGRRISEFTPWGSFVKAFGWDVAPGAVNESQEVRVRAASGQFKLKFKGETSADLPFDASAGELEAALEALPSIGAGGVKVEAVAGALDGSVPIVYAVAFNGATLKGTDLPQLEAINGTAPLSGGVPSTVFEARTRADGHTATAGPESCTKESGCKKGLSGAGAGQLKEEPGGIAVDPAGDLFLMEVDTHRVQKFDSAGRFVSMFGGEVDKTTSADICTAASGHLCGEGVAGSGPGEFGGNPAALGDGGLALCPSGTTLCPSGAIFAPDGYRVERFSLGGEFESQFEVDPGNLQKLAFNPAAEDLYATFGEKEGVHEISATTGAEIPPVRPVNGAGPLASDGEGDVFAPSAIEHEVLEYGPGGSPLAPPSCCEALPGLIPIEPFRLTGLATNPPGTLYVANFLNGVGATIRFYGPGPVVFEAPPKRPPEITAQFASAVQRDGARVAALINPHFWSDTRYFVQYGVGKCSESGCNEEVPLAPGALLTPNVFGSPVRSADVFLERLSPGTTYHYRFVAKSGGGGPVFGVGGGTPEEVGEETVFKEVGEESSFTTYRLLPPQESCPNQGFRAGAAAQLPDCRAYEMVSPLEKNNGDVRAMRDVPGFSTAVSQSAADGNGMTYSSYRSYGEPAGAPYVSQYLASRDPSTGWSSEAIDVAQNSLGTVGFNLENPYKAFSEDLCQSWLVVASEPLLTENATPGYHELYRRDGCGEEPSYEALTGVEPNVEPKGFNPELQGSSADGKAAILRVKDNLAEGAVSGFWQAYYADEGVLHALCILPSGAPSGANCSGGTGGSASFNSLHRLASVNNALSADGSRAYWTDSGLGVEHESGPGAIYLRLNPADPESANKDGKGNCVPEAGKACTLPVSGTKTTKASYFLGASEDGSKALFKVTEGTLEGDLYEFKLGKSSGSSSLIAGEVIGVAAASEDLSRIYFVSEEALAVGASGGERNLYLDEGGTKTFIATLSQTDVLENSLSDTSFQPVRHAARTTPDGGVLAFISTASPTGYDNTDLEREEADSEVYLYEAGSAGPVCVSCNPGGARPVGRRVSQGAGSDKIPTAAQLPPATTDLHVPRALSADGKRLFFNSFDSLLPRDTNGAEDVYEWESAQSREACEELGAETYLPSAAGCLSLISSGKSPTDSEFLDASASGDDVFFTTESSLLASDPDLIDAYDARVGGGFPEPPPPPAECRGEACRGTASSPSVQTPASSTYEGPENQKPKKKHHKKHHHHKHHKKQQQRHRGAAR
jgi:hypothetical protein